MSTNKAFIFDLDGVLIDSEGAWAQWKSQNYPRIFGDTVARKIGTLAGISIAGICELAAELGSKTSKEMIMSEFENQAKYIYKQAPITPSLSKLGRVLAEHNYNIGIVSNSSTDSINSVLERIPFGQNIQIIISLHERPDLAHKPAPDGYNEAIQALGASPDTTLILEDANPGIASAKASCAKVIGLRQNLLKGYEQQGADIYAETIEDVIVTVRSFSLSLKPLS